MSLCPANPTRRHMTGEIPRTQLIEELVSLLRVPDALVGKVAKLPDGWEYGNDVDRAEVLRGGSD